MQRAWRWEEVALDPEVRSYSSPQRQVARVWGNSDAGSRAVIVHKLTRTSQPAQDAISRLTACRIPPSEHSGQICVRILARRFVRSDDPSEARGSERRYKPSPPFVLRVSPSLASTPCRPSRTCSRRSRPATATLSRTLWLVASSPALATTPSHVPFCVETRRHRRNRRDRPESIRLGLERIH